MSKRATKAARAELERQQQSGTHNPARECSCGTWHSPGMPHATDDTGPTPKTGRADHDG